RTVAQLEFTAFECDQSREDIIIFPIVTINRIREDSTDEVRTYTDGRNKNQLVRILYCKRSQQKLVRNTKDRGVCADAQGEREDDHQCESRPLAKSSYGVT